MKIIGWVMSACILFFAATNVGAQDVDKRTPVERYKGETVGGVIECGLRIEMLDLQQTTTGYASALDELYNCISKSKTAARSALNLAVASLRKEKALEALKQHYIAFSAAMDNLKPSTSESKLVWQQRRSADKAKMNEAWARFEVEE